MDQFILISPLILGVILDYTLGDPMNLPHPVVYMGKSISFFEKRLNNGSKRVIKGAIISIMLIVLTYIITYGIVYAVSANIYLYIIVSAILIFYCLAGKTLIDEVKMVFKALNESLDKGRAQLSRIVGRDTAELTDEEVKKAALETLAENLSDGVIAPLFWFAIGGLPAMMTYKMVNTLDSMIGYKSDRFKDFMLLVSGRLKLISFVIKYGKEHASPNSGYPEAALAGILNCKFGGTHNYFGESVYKPYIGNNDRTLKYGDMIVATSINRNVEIVMVVLNISLIYLLS